MNKLPLNARFLNILRHYSQNVSKPPGSSSGIGKSQVTGSSGTQGINTNVPGLSNKCVKSATEPVGPGASPTGEYKVPEYFLYSKATYYEAELELAKYRLPQPSAVQK